MFFKKRIIICIVIVLLHIFFTKSNLFAQQSETYVTIPVSHPVHISASVGTFGQSSVFGYAPPFSTIELSSTISLALTASDKSGYFEFSNVSIDAATQELCVMGTDKEGRSTQPSCFPYSTSFEGKKIGPIVLSPTFSISSTSQTASSPIVLTGKAPADSSVILHYSSAQDGGVNPVKRQNRAILQDSSIETKTDKNGLYSFSLDIPNLEQIQVYTTTKWDSFSSNKSMNLFVDILPWWLLLLKKILLLLLTSRFDVLSIILAIEVLVAILLFYSKMKKPRSILILENALVKRSFLPKRFASPLVTTESSAVLRK